MMGSCTTHFPTKAKRRQQKRSKVTTFFRCVLPNPFIIMRKIVSLLKLFDRMKLHFLGTGTSSGVPQMGCSCAVCRSADPRDKRTRCSALLETDDRRLILIDCGPDFRSQMLRFLDEHPYHPQSDIPFHTRNVTEMTPEQARAAGLHEPPSHNYALPAIEAVVITHEHFDHVAGLDDLRPFSVFHPITIFAEPNVAAPILRNMAYCFAEKRYPGSPHLIMQEIDSDRPFSIGQTEVQPIRVLHGRLPIVGFRIGALVYITDMSALPPEEWPKLRGVDTLVVNALRHEPHPTHQSIAEATAFAQRMGARQTYFIHMSHGAGFHAAAADDLPHNVHFAHDGMTISID